jgi:hypothetical protein
MNNKLFLLGVIAAVFTANGFAGDKTDRIKELNNNGYYWLKGFPFKDYKPETEGLQPRIKDEASVIKKSEAERDKNGTTNNYVLAGHSQGGLRALAIGGYLKTNDTALYDKLDGIITISGIDRGLKALEGGVGNLASRVQDDINIVWGGVRATLGIWTYPIVNSMFPGVPDFSVGTKFILRLIPESFQFYYVKLGLENKPDKIQEIKDMTPFSDFIKANVADIQKKSQLVKEKIGTKLVAKVGSKKVLFVTLYYIYFALEDVYRTYTRTWEEDSTLKVGEEMPVGYIVGTNNNVFAPLGSDETKVRNGIKATRSVFIAAEAVHIAKCLGIVGLFTGSPQYISDAHRAQDFCGNIDGELHAILGSSANDGLVARESQFYPTAIHKNQLGYQEFKYSHEAMEGEKNVLDFVKTWTANANLFRVRDSKKK